MNVQRPSDELDLHALDPARPANPTAARSVQAQALLERVVATPREAQGTDAGWSPSRSTRAQGGRRWAWILGAVAAVTVAALLLPGLGDREAFASWTARPAGVPVEDAELAAEACRDVWAETATAGPAADSQAAPVLTTQVLEDMDVVLAERRGDHLLTIIGSDGWLAQCLLGPGAGGSALAPPGLYEQFGPLPPDTIDWISALTSGIDEGYYVAVFGRVGADVVAVTLQPPGLEPVQATVAAGYYAAWWPTTDPRSDDPTRITATVRLRSGEVREGVHPTDFVDAAQERQKT